jgi:glycosyltransferase involved in cell wall biosynthesis
MNPVWCAIPVYNNAATIADIVTRCKAQLDQIIVVDDGSADADLRDLLKPLGVEVIRHLQNRGKGAALLTAFDFAARRGAEYLITLDGDAQHFPEDIPKFLERLSQDTILIGSRDQIVGTMPGSSRFGRDFSDFWICIECGAKTSDTQSGFRAYPLKHVTQLPLASRHYNLEVEVVTRAVWAGMRIGSVPIRVAYSPATRAASSFKPFIDNARISLIHTRLVIRQLLPIPHRKIVADTSKSESLLTENATPLGLAACVGITALLAILLWPWGFLAAAYVAWRLHLNKIVTAATLLLCAPRALPNFCYWVGKSLASPTWAHFVGAHVVAFIAAPVAAFVVYRVARKMRPERRA